MAKFLSSKFILFLIWLNILLYILSCLSPYIHPKYFFGFTFLALGFPLLFIGIVFWLLLFFITRHKRKWLLLIVLLPGYNNFRATVGLNFFTNEKSTNSNKRIIIASWNINEFGNLFIKKYDSSNGIHQKIIQEIKNINADIICLQDFSDVANSDCCIENETSIKKVLGYPYHYFAPDYRNFVLKKSKEWVEQFRYGTIIYSKFPITNQGKISFFVDSFLNEGISYVDVIIQSKPYRIINTHFKSIQLNLPNFNISKEMNYPVQDTNFSFHTSKFGKLKRSDTTHARQAKLMKHFLDTTKIPFIFCGDLNSVPTSYAYYTISKNLKDAFIEKGKGFGTTYSGISPTLRIDVILTSSSLNIQSYNVNKTSLSDHYPVYCTISLN